MRIYIDGRSFGHFIHGMWFLVGRVVEDEGALVDTDLVDQSAATGDV